MSGIDRILLENVHGGPFYGVKLEFAHGQRHVVTGPSGSGKTAVVSELLHGLTAQALSPFLDRDRLPPLMPRFAVRTSAATGLRLPVIFGGSPQALGRLRCGEVLGWDRLLTSLVRDAGELRCPIDDTRLVTGGFDAVLETLSTRNVHGLIIAVGVNLEAGPQRVIHVEALRAQGIRRIVAAGELFRLDDERADAHLRGPGAVLGVIGAVEWDGSDEQRVRLRELASEAAATQRQSFAGEASVGICLVDGPRSVLFPVRRGAVCPRCGFSCDDPAGAVEQALAGTPAPAAAVPGTPRTKVPVLKLEDRQLDWYWNTSAAEMLQVWAANPESPVAAALSGVCRALTAFHLSTLELGRTCGRLSPGQWLFLQCACFDLHRALNSLLIFDEVDATLHSDDLRLLLTWTDRVCASGNTIIWSSNVAHVVAEAHQVLALRPEVVRPQRSSPAPSAPRIGTKLLSVPLPRSRTVIELPLGALTAVAGRSGTGKTEFLRVIASVVRGRRSKWRVTFAGERPVPRGGARTVGEFLGVASRLADRLASQREARQLGLRPSDFLRAGGTGLCADCNGRGELRFLSAIGELLCDPCETCLGEKFDSRVLSVRLLGRTVSEIARLSLSELRVYAAADAVLAERLEIAAAAGLGAVPLERRLSECSRIVMNSLLLVAILLRRPESQLLVLLDGTLDGLEPAVIDYAIASLRAFTDCGATIVAVSNDARVCGAANRLIECSVNGLQMAADAGASEPA